MALTGRLPYSAVGGYLYTKSEIASRRGIGSLAQSGNTILNQQNLWTASPWSSAVGIAGVVIQVGINDVFTGATAATIISGLQTLVNTVRTAQPLTKIVLCQLLPCSTYLTNNLGAAYQTKWVAVNDAIAGRGGSPITGADLVLLTGDVGSALNDGSNNIPAALRVSDLIHTNNPGKQVNAGIVYAGFVSEGVL